MSKPTTPSPPPDGSKQGRRATDAERRFSVFDAFIEGVTIVNKDYEVVYMNAIEKAAVGDLVGRKCYDTALGSDEICRFCPVESDWDFDKGPILKRAVDATGRSVEITIYKHQGEEPDEQFWIAVEHDVTERVRTENQLAIIVASLDQMPEPACVADTGGNLLHANKAYLTLTGYDEHGVFGPTLSETLKAGSSSETMQSILRRAVNGSWQGEMTGLRTDGTRYFVDVEAEPVTNSAGDVIGVVSLLRDITREKTEKVELEKYRAELEKKVEARTRELAQRVNQLTTINKISRVATSTLDLDELISEFVKAIAQGFGYKHVSMWMVDKERGDLSFRAGYGWQMDSVPKGQRQKLKEGIIGHAAYFGETLVSGDVEADPRYVRRDITGTKSELSVPVSFRGEIVGVLDIQNDFKDAFTRNDVTTMEMLADMLATSITNARIFSESKEREQALSVLDRISKQISYRLEPEVILQQVAQDAASLLKAEKAMVGLVDEPTQTLDFVAAYKVEKELVKSKKYKSNIGVSGRALRLLKTEIVNDYLSDPDAVEEDAEMFNIRSIACAPLAIEGRGIGVINVYNKLGGKPFTKSEGVFLSSLADHAAIALENANLLASLNQRIHSQLALLDTALSIQRQIDTSRVYELIADKMKDVVWNDGLTFYKLNHETNIIQPLFSRGLYAKEIMVEEFSIGVGLTGYVAKTGKAEMVDDATKDPRVAQIAGTPLEREALMCIPLTGKERVIGVLSLYREGDKTFSSTEFEIAQLFASQAAVAIENVELYRARESLLVESRRKVEQMAKVLELTSSVMYMDDLQMLLQRIADAVVQSFGFKRACVNVYDLDNDTFTRKGLAGYPSWVKLDSERPAKPILEDFADDYRIAPTTYYVPYERQNYGMERFAFLAHPELANKPRAAPDAWHERDFLMVAFKDRSGRFTGYLLVDEPNDLKIPKMEQIDVLEILAGIASIALENSKVYEKQVSAASEIALLNDLMSHDINNFNQGIMGYIELLLEDKRLDDNQRHYAERALMQVKNNARLIDNMRKLAKIRMMTDSDFVPMDLQKAVVEAITVVTKSATGDRRLSIVSSLAQNTHFVMANQFLNDLVLNIISNAVKFDSARRVRVDVLISEEESTKGSFWVLSVADRGRGIPDDRKNVVFERFATGMTGIKGFGLGLSIARAIVDKLGGRIWVEDRIKGDFAKGTVFKIALPKASVKRTEPAPAPAPEQTS